MFKIFKIKFKCMLALKPFTILSCSNYAYTKNLARNNYFGQYSGCDRPHVASITLMLRISFSSDVVKLLSKKEKNFHEGN